MRRKIVICLSTFIFMFVVYISNVNSLSCIYSSDNETYKDDFSILYKVNELIIDINDFELKYTKTDFSHKSSTMDSFQSTDFDGANSYSIFQSKLTIDDFISGEKEDRNLNCPDLYFKVETGYDYKTYIILKEQKGLKLKLKSNTDNTENITDVLEESDWINVCRYGSNILKISEKTFNFSNIDSKYLHFDIDDIKKYQDDCPPYICSSVADGMGTYYSIRDTDASTYNFECEQAISITGDCVVYDRLYDEYNIKQNQKILEKLKLYCSNQLATNDFDHVCVKACLNLEQDIKENIITTGECNFSQRLIGIIGGILKWIKYILPVIAIVLGILDFIKAIGSDKDDEMKKAQGKFIKRLVSAALVFIIPLILEFVLSKMGFAYNECGLFD